MQEVFEKIIEKLEEEKSKVPVNRLLDDIIKDKPKELGQLMAYSNSVKIVKQVAEEYNNGWIPVEEKLPEEHELYDITFKNDAGIHSDSAIYEPFSENWYWCDDETELLEGDKVLAWAEKREPYQPKGDKE